MSDKKHVIITVSGGIVQDVHGLLPSEVTIVDWDAVESEERAALDTIDWLTSIDPEAIPDNYNLSDVLDELRREVEYHARQRDAEEERA